MGCVATLQRNGMDDRYHILDDMRHHVRICYTGRGCCCDVCRELSAPSVVSAEATWYGSLRAGVSSHDSDTKFADGGSRWGIKGSSEISDGLTAVYRFEHKIDTAKASLTDGRLAYAGLKGGFGTITAGQIWSASFNSVGAITDNSFAYGNSETTYRHGSVVSYANSFGPASVQLDLVMDGARDSGNKDIDQVEFGLSVALGDIGKIAIAHVNKEDMPATMTNTVAVYKHTIGAGTNTAMLRYSPTAWTATTTVSWYTGTIKPTTVITIAVRPVNLIVARDKTYKYDDKGGRTDQGNFNLIYVEGTTTTTISIDNSATSRVGECERADVNADDACVTKTDQLYVTLAGGIPSDPAQATSFAQYTYLPEDLIMKMNPGSKTNHIAAEFSFGGVTPYLGYSEKKTNGMMKKDKTTFVGVRGSVGDTGFGYVFQYRDKEAMKDGMMMEYEPWILGLSKTMGGGASLHFEHSNPGGMKDANGKKVKSTTGVWLKVDF